MMKNVKIAMGLFIFTLFILFIDWMPSVWGMASRPPLVGSQAPEFQLMNLSGATQSLEHYRGKVVLVNFWATWCQPCTKEMPAMQAAHTSLQDQGFAVLAINELEDIQKVRDHILEHQHTFDVLLDPDNHVANMYGVVGLPVSVFIDKSGRVRKIIKGGLLTEQLIHETVQPLLQETVTASQKVPPL
jgi:peroxiredoxin